jgi:chemotaxis protein CheZ
MPEANGFSARLAQFGERYPQADAGLVAEVVREVLSSMRAEPSAGEAALLAEVEELGRTVANARAEIAALKVDDINASHIPSATDELDAIVAHTAAATNSILECCERLDALSPSLSGEPAQILQDVTTNIYEACSFQDITGQRITKVVATLKAIEAKVAHIITAFHSEAAPAEEPTAATPPSLLNGPQLPANAMDQADIDALLASFD